MFLMKVSTSYSSLGNLKHFRFPTTRLQNNQSSTIIKRNNYCQTRLLSSCWANNINSNQFRPKNFVDLKWRIQTRLLSGSNNESFQTTVSVNEDDRGVRRITLNNPKKRNALSLTMIQELRHHLNREDFVSGKSLRAIVIDANGEKVFSSGHDLKQLNPAANSAESSTAVFDECSKLMLDIRSLPVPVICQVDGLAAAAGCQLMASCDIAIVTERSKFSTPGADVGLFCSTPGIAVSRSANLKTAAFMVLTGKPITAQEALTAGLVTRVVATVSDLQNETESILASILSKSSAVIALGKKFFYHQLDLDISAAYREGGCVMVDNLQIADGREGIDAFINKRKPKWEHSHQ